MATEHGADPSRQSPWPPYPGNVPPHSPGPGMNPHLPAPKLKLTPDEIQALQECTSESFWYRCVPLGVLFVGSTQMMVNRGIFKPHPKYGAILKNMGASLVAYIVGKFSYQTKCRAKILALENSPLADSIRQGKRGREVMQDYGFTQGQHLYETPDVQQRQPPSRLQDKYSQDIDFHKVDKNVQHSGLDDSRRPSVDYEVKLEDPSLQKSSGTNYDELRQQNREEYSRKISALKAPPGGSQSIQGAPAGPYQGGYVAPQTGYSRPEQRSTPTRRRTNQYGDAIED